MACPQETAFPKRSRHRADLAQGEPRSLPFPSLLLQVPLFSQGGGLPLPTLRTKPRPILTKGPFLIQGCGGLTALGEGSATHAPLVHRAWHMAGDTWVSLEQREGHGRRREGKRSGRRVGVVGLLAYNTPLSTSLQICGQPHFWCA